MSVSSELIKNVSDTAWWTATGRFLESKRDDALFKDPLAGLLIEGREQMLSNLLPTQYLSAMMAVRTKLLDDLVMELIKGKKIDAVINLACGLCTRVFRLPLPQSMHWVEVDFPAMIQFKQEKLSPIAAPCDLEFRAVDLRQAEARQMLLKEVTERHENVLVITEGLLPYLTESNVTQLAAELITYDVRYWLSDFYMNVAQDLVNSPEIYQAMKKADAMLQFDPESGLDFFQEHGWTLKKQFNFVEEAKRLDRMPPQTEETKTFGSMLHGNAYIILAEPKLG